MYRVIARQDDVNGRYWAYELPKNKMEWRASYAVADPWNSNGYYVTYTFPEDVPIWEGVTATQDLSEESFDGEMLRGGKTQVFVPSAWQDVPEDLEMMETNWSN